MTAIAPLPVSLIAGYLGAGKTTLINHLLKHADGRKIIVMVNDFGDLVIDQSLIESDDGDTITLANGCVCCSMNADLFKAFATALDRQPRPDHLVIEASGVAEPHRIANIARAEPDLRLDVIVTVVDAINAPHQLSDSLITDSVQNQIKAAHILMLSKSELVENTDEICQRLKQLNPNATIIDQPPPADLLLSPSDIKPVTLSAQHNHDEIYQSWSYESDHCPDNDQLQHMLNNLPAGLLRFKAIACERDGSATILHAVAHDRQMERRQLPNKQPGFSALAIGLKTQFPSTELITVFETPFSVS